MLDIEKTTFSLFYNTGDKYGEFSVDSALCTLSADFEKIVLKSWEEAKFKKNLRVRSYGDPRYDGYILKIEHDSGPPFYATERPAYEVRLLFDPENNEYSAILADIDTRVTDKKTKGYVPLMHLLESKRFINAYTEFLDTMHVLLCTLTREKVWEIYRLTEVRWMTRRGITDTNFDERRLVDPVYDTIDRMVTVAQERAFFALRKEAEESVRFNLLPGTYATNCIQTYRTAFLGELDFFLNVVQTPLMRG